MRKFMCPGLSKPLTFPFSSHWCMAGMELCVIVPCYNSQKAWTVSCRPWWRRFLLAMFGTPTSPRNGVIVYEGSDSGALNFNGECLDGGERPSTFFRGEMATKPRINCRQLKTLKLCYGPYGWKENELLGSLSSEKFAFDLQPSANVAEK